MGRILLYSVLRDQDSNLEPSRYTLSQCFHQGWTISSPYTNRGEALPAMLHGLCGTEVLPFGIVSTPSEQNIRLGSGLPFQASPNSPRFFNPNYFGKLRYSTARRSTIELSRNTNTILTDREGYFNRVRIHHNYAVIRSSAEGLLRSRRRRSSKVRSIYSRCRRS